MLTNKLLIGDNCFIVKARALPNGYNQRPGMTLLLSTGSTPLELEIEGLLVRGYGWLLAPELRRRFTRPQPHTSITLEPGNTIYSALLAWARTSQFEFQSLQDPASISLLANACSQLDLESHLGSVVEQHRQTTPQVDIKLAYLLSLVDEAEDDATAESIWRVFRIRYPSTQAHCSHWLKDCIGIPLRKLLLWRKLRRALEMLSDNKPATEVAHAAGFADSAHLSRICLRTFGLKPSQANDHKILQVSRLPAA